MSATIVLTVLGGYAAIGMVFAAAFASIGAARIDPAARGAPLGFRLLILPGAAALWPLLAVKWVSAARTEQRHAA